jgi:hypothetical protein
MRSGADVFQNGPGPAATMLPADPPMAASGMNIPGTHISLTKG